VVEAAVKSLSGAAEAESTKVEAAEEASTPRADVVVNRPSPHSRVDRPHLRR